MRVWQRLRRRFHLTELEDLAWFPSPVRDGATAFLVLVSKLTGGPESQAAALARVLEISGRDQILDLCSGGTGALLTVLESLESRGLQVGVTLTDLYPNQGAFEEAARRFPERVRYSLKSVDATEVNGHTRSVRTMFNALHHFPPTRARKLLEQAVRSREPVGVFELVGADLRTFLGIPLVALSAFLLWPWVRPRRLSWWLLTYLLPLIPFTLLWDGWVSWWRAYTVAELEALVEGLDTDYHWEVRRLPGRLTGITCLLGWPLAGNSEIARSGSGALP